MLDLVSADFGEIFAQNGGYFFGFYLYHNI